MKMDLNFKFSIALLGGLCLSFDAVAQEDEPLDVAHLEPLSIIGSREDLFSTTGSGYVIDHDLIQTHGYADINQALKQVPGVYLRTEDGHGLFPNISLRGVDPSRMSKLTYMEDGILAAPSSYSAPSAYYTPTVGRMIGLEVLKGSSQIQHGPHTTGGVINYLSTPIPHHKSSYLRFSYGTENDTRLHLWTGDRVDSSAGEFGYLVETYYRETDGFKSIDSTAGFDGSSRGTGFQNHDSMLKLSWSPKTENRQYFELKTGYMDKNADETYLGLSTTDFLKNRNRRYAASRDDNIDTQHFRNYLRYSVALSDNASLSATAYYNAFNRNWYKLKEIKDIDSDGDGFIDSTPTVLLYQALAGIDDNKPLEVLQGIRAGQYEYRNNNRGYIAKGVQATLNVDFDAGETVHHLLVGTRFHQDQVRRFQDDVQYFQDSSGAITSTVSDGPGSGGNRLQESEATALFIEDTIRLGRFSIIPGLRYERIDYRYIDFENNGDNIPTGDASRTLDIFAPGIGFSYQSDESSNLFAGIYRGFSVPGPRSASRPGRQLDEETSISFETGIRFDNSKGIYAELVGFNTHLDDLATIDNIATGTSNPQNIGEARSRGVEAIFGWDLTAKGTFEFKAPISVSATYTDATFKSNSTDVNAESIFAGAVIGNAFPYVPEWQLNLAANLEFDTFRLSANLNYTDSTFGSGSNSMQELDPSGSPDARFGLIESQFIVDLSVNYFINEHAEAFVNVTNLLDEQSLAGRLTDGPRPNAPRQASIGMGLRF
ncbi:TonB-dependent receptor family protein [Candidatus Pelagisphaera phototrophica]|uniref:TonB-dependent receptor family protein n=1 Tax=Candidatus Pelagisphaera phototrophica TaxID=2684113 RepID=UPI0019F63187|nr:TonB-dependent receptor [Candidatus Pelagisphaera phototrophica]QXD31662.1 TonB-dependent receptor [Candidatus Pelagisphaera phototrophica]